MATLVWRVLAATLILTLAVAGCAAPPAPAPKTDTTVGSGPAAAKPAAAIVWKGQTAYTPPTDYGPYQSGVVTCPGSTIAFNNWIKQETKGGLAIDIAAAGAIVPVAQMYEAVSKGALDFAGLYYGGFHTGVMPETDVEIGLPFAWESGEEAWDAYYNRGMLAELQKIYAEQNIYFMPVFCNSTYSFGTTFPAPNLESLKGKKIRALGIYGDLMKAVDASPVVVAGPEMYMALKLGTIDGAIYGLETLWPQKLYEVWKYYVTVPNLNSIVGSYLINLDKWKALPDEYRQLIEGNGKYFMLGVSTNNYTWELYWAAKAAKESPFQLVQWPSDDVAKIRKIGFGLWDRVAGKSARSAKLVDIVRKQMAEIGKLK